MRTTVLSPEGGLTINDTSSGAGRRQVWGKPVKPNRQKVLTRLERFWFATGILFFGLKGIPVERRSLPKATPPLPRAVSKADARDAEPGS